MSCHNIGFSIHNPDDLRRALSKRLETCENCDGVLDALSEDAKVIDDRIIYRVFCLACDKTSVREIRFYAPKDTYSPLDT
jgi:hypothetical protein